MKAKPAKGHTEKRTLTIKVSPLGKTLLDEIASEHGLTLQDLGLEALNLLLETYGRKPVA